MWRTTQIYCNSSAISKELQVRDFAANSTRKISPRPSYASGLMPISQVTLAWTVKALGGYWIELASEDGLRSWALHWSYSKQGFTAGHTQEAEIAAMYDAIRNDGLPLATHFRIFTW
jgi:hypothetical protein